MSDNETLSGKIDPTTLGGFVSFVMIGVLRIIVVMVVYFFILKVIVPALAWVARFVYDALGIEHVIAYFKNLFRRNRS